MSDNFQSPRRTADQWQALLQKQIQSGLSGAAFCKAEGITYQTFMSWRSKLTHIIKPTKPKSKPQFVELTASNKQPATHEPTWLVELDLAPGIQLRIAR